MSERILITGGTGLLALNWALALRDRHAITLGTHSRTIALARVTTTPVVLDDADAFAGALERVAPTVVVHAAGMTNIEACERHPDEARHVRARPHRLRIAARTGRRTRCSTPLAAFTMPSRSHSAA